MIGSSLGLGIGLQGQPKQYAEMAYKKLASDAAVKKQQADSDKEFLKLYKDAIFVKPGYVLPGQSEEYQEMMATAVARINQKHEERDFTGAVQELNNFKMEAQPYLTNYTKMQALGKVLGQSAVDEKTYNMYMTGGKDQFNQATLNKFSGIFYDPNTKTLSPNVYPRVDLLKKIKSNLLDEQFITVGQGRDAAGKPTDIKKLTDTTKAAIITGNMADPALIQTYSVELGNMPENRDLDAETFDMKVKQRIQDETRRIIDVLEREKSTGAGVTVNNFMGDANREIIDIVGGGSSDINYSGTVIEATGSINLGNIKSVKAASGDMFDTDGNKVTEAGISDFTIGTSYYVPTLNESLTADEIKKIEKKVSGNQDLLALVDKLVEKRKDGTINVKNEPIPKGLDKIIAEEVPNKVSVRVLSTLKDSKDKYGKDVFMVSDVNQVEQIINNSDKSKVMKVNLIKQLKENALKREDKLKTKSTSQQKTPAPKTGTKNEFEQYFRK